MLSPRKKQGKSYNAGAILVIFSLLINVIWIYSSAHMHLEATTHFSDKDPPLQLRRSTVTTPLSVHNEVKLSRLETTPLSVHNEVKLSRLEASIWSTRKLPIHDETKRTQLQKEIQGGLEEEERKRLKLLCGKLLYSSIEKGAIQMEPDHSTFVATGDIPFMWTRDSTVQIALLYNRPKSVLTNFRAILEGTLRKNAFYIVQDPYANAYTAEYKHPLTGWEEIKDRVIGRGGWVATRNYELDSGAYFLNQLWDYYAMDFRAAKRLYQDNTIVDAVKALVDMWTIEQNHDTQSQYRYFELPNEGKGSPTSYTGMTWTGFRPSDDPCIYHYLVPANIHAAAGLERVLELNQDIWKDPDLQTTTEKLLEGIVQGIRNHGIVDVKQDDGSYMSVYAYEVDGMGNSVSNYDDANVPSLLSIPLLGWSGYDHAVYENTRKHVLSPANRVYFKGKTVTGIGSDHTNDKHVWPMAMVIQALTTEDSNEILQKIRELLKVAECMDAMHESVHMNSGCKRRSRDWFEWANALFVVLVEAVLDDTCDATGQDLVRSQLITEEKDVRFYSNKYKNNPWSGHNYQGIQAFVKHNDNKQMRGTRIGRQRSGTG